MLNNLRKTLKEPDTAWFFPTENGWNKTGICVYHPVMTILLSNAEARRIFLARQGLSAPPGRLLGKAGLLQLIHDIGFVQVDSIATVERAHHQILFSRNQTYRREHLTELLETDGDLFEHWTHDASIIPSEFFRYWKHRFRRKEASILERWSKWQGEVFDATFEETYARIASGGPVLSRDLKTDEHKSGGWWTGIRTRRRSNFSGTPADWRSPGGKTSRRSMT